jgi:uncharacterized protein (DUF433 family)
LPLPNRLQLLPRPARQRIDEESRRIRLEARRIRDAGDFEFALTEISSNMKLKKEIPMSDGYITRTSNGGYRVAGTRISLDSVIHAWWNGRLPEAIVADFPGLTLEQVHGAIAYYLGHRSEVDRYLAEQDQRWDEFQRESAARMGPLVQRMRSAAASSSETLP